MINRANFRGLWAGFRLPLGLLVVSPGLSAQTVPFSSGRYTVDENGVSVTITAESSTSNDVSIRVIDDLEIEDDETLVITLFNPSADAVLGMPTTHPHTIEDNDFPEESFSSATYTIGEEGGTAIITVNIDQAPVGSATIGGCRPDQLRARERRFRNHRLHERGLFFGERICTRSGNPCLPN